jgi:hypothetical protein
MLDLAGVRRRKQGNGLMGDVLDHAEFWLWRVQHYFSLNPRIRTRS